MFGNVDLSLVNWSRAQFALTAIYHWLFVPLTLGLSFIIAIMESIYVKTGNEEWKRITRFWMTLFGINFAIGVATGIILEFEFGTNWSNYSWFVGDIFGAPLAVEGILAFFLESTFIAVMFFGWNKVSRGFHLASSWLVAAGASLSALWIIVANGWMQYPVGMIFNPETARNEMVNFWEVLFNKIAVFDFLHTISSGFLLASVFVLGISAYYLIRKREERFALKSILVAGIFGLLSSFLVAFTGDLSAKIVSKVQPVKFASMEALYNGQKNPGLVAAGILKTSGRSIGSKKICEFSVKVEIPGFLSIMTGVGKDVFIPGITDLVQGNPLSGLLSVPEMMERGKTARNLLADYKTAKNNKEVEKAKGISGMFRDKTFIDNYFRYFGYAFIDKPEDVIPDVKLTFYTFHIMVLFGFYFILLFILSIWFLFRGTLQRQRWLLRAALFSILFPYVAGELGWVLTEMGRHPWIIQNLMPVNIGVSQIAAGNVITTFILFAVLFTVLLIAEISIMIKQIKLGPRH